MNHNILIIGASSGIAESVSRLYAEQGAGFFLVARNENKLKAISSDLTARGAKEVRIFVMDANDSGLLLRMLDAAWRDFGAIDIALVAHGTLPDQSRAESDISYTITEFRTNAESIISSLTALAQYFERQGKGVIAVVSSVAGDRGRASNYLYGAAKAAVDTYASGLRARLLKHNVHMLVIKPGFVATPMTVHLDLPERLTATPCKVAKDIQRAITKNTDVLYTPWYWKWIMLIIRWMPSPIFNRVKF